MRHLFYFFFGGTSLLIVSIMGFYYHEQNVELQTYKKTLSGVQKDYKKLEKDLFSYLDQTKKIKQLTILAKNQDSKNIQIADTLRTYSEKVSGDVSIYYKNLVDEEVVAIDENKTYYMASLYKVILTLYILEEVKSGSLKLTDTVQGSTITIEQALRKIITESNNEYAAQLAEQYGWKTIEQAMKLKFGIDFSFNADLKASSQNIGVLFEKIAVSLDIPDWESDYLLDLLNNQKKISKLPKYLPQHIYSHNKTGEFNEYSHDAGIFYTPKGNYILVFMSSSKNPDATNEQMALMSKEIYDILNN